MDSEAYLSSTLNNTKVRSKYEAADSLPLLWSCSLQPSLQCNKESCHCLLTYLGQGQWGSSQKHLPAVFALWCLPAYKSPYFQPTGGAWRNRRLWKHRRNRPQGKSKLLYDWPLWLSLACMLNIKLVYPTCVPLGWWGHQRRTGNERTLWPRGNTSSPNHNQLLIFLLLLSCVGLC